MKRKSGKYVCSGCGLGIFTGYALFSLMALLNPLEYGIHQVLNLIGFSIVIGALFGGVLGWVLFMLGKPADRSI